MTQIFSCVFRNHAFHVSDRLLSRSHNGRRSIFEGNANKTVIFKATDAHVVLGYSGLAFLGSLPTDTFIAQSLLGNDLSNQPALTIGSAATPVLDISRSIERLRRDLTTAFCDLPQEDTRTGLHISVMGWRRKRARRNRLVPISCELVWHTGPPNAEFQIMRPKRWYAWDREIRLQYVPDIQDDSLRDSVFQQIMDHGCKSPGDLKQVLVDGLRRCSDASPDRIGRACLQVELTPVLQTKAHIKFIPDMQDPDRKDPFDFDFFPWIVVPPYAAGPSSSCGIKGASIGGFEWKIENPISWQVQRPGRAVAGFRKQQRRANPRRK